MDEKCLETINPQRIPWTSVLDPTVDTQEVSVANAHMELPAQIAQVIDGTVPQPTFAANCLFEYFCSSKTG